MTPPANACSLADDPRAGKAASFESFEAAINAAIAAVHAERRRPVSAPAGGAGLQLGFRPGSQPALALEAGADWAAPLQLAMPKLRVKVASPRTAGLSGSGSSHASMPPAAQAPALGGAPGSGVGAPAGALGNPSKPSRSAPLSRASSAPFSPVPPLPARARAPVLAGKGQSPGPEPGRGGWLPDTPLAGPSDAGGPYSVQHRASYGSAGPHAGPHGAQVDNLEAMLPGDCVGCVWFSLNPGLHLVPVWCVMVLTVAFVIRCCLSILLITLLWTRSTLRSSGLRRWCRRRRCPGPHRRLPQRRSARRLRTTATRACAAGSRRRALARSRAPAPGALQRMVESSWHKPLNKKCTECCMPVVTLRPSLTMSSALPPLDHSIACILCSLPISANGQ